MSPDNKQTNKPAEGLAGVEASKETLQHKECAKVCLDYHRKFDPDRYFVPSKDHVTFANGFSKYENLSNLGPVAQHRGAYCKMMARLFRLGEGNSRVSSAVSQNDRFLKNLVTDYRSILRSESFSALKADDLKSLIQIFADCSISLKSIPNKAQWERGARKSLSAVGDRFDDPKAIENLKMFVDKALQALNKLHKEKEEKERRKPSKGSKA